MSCIWHRVFPGILQVIISNGMVDSPQRDHVAQKTESLLKVSRESAPPPPESLKKVRKRGTLGTFLGLSLCLSSRRNSSTQHCEPCYLFYDYFCLYGSFNKIDQTKRHGRKMQMATVVSWVCEDWVPMELPFLVLARTCAAPQTGEIGR